MSKRYVIQVNLSTDPTNPMWENYQFDNGGDSKADWMTRSRNTALVDAAKIKHSGETRELRVMISQPVYELVPAGVGDAEITEVMNTVHPSWLENDSDDDSDDANEN